VTRPLTDDEFAGRIDDLDEPALRAFVADLLAAVDGDRGTDGADSADSGDDSSSGESGDQSYGDGGDLGARRPVVHVLGRRASEVPGPGTGVRSDATATDGDAGSRRDADLDTDVDAHPARERVAVTRSPATDDLRASARERGVRLLDPAALRRLALYAVPPATGDALCRDHLDTPVRVEGTAPTAAPAAVDLVGSGAPESGTGAVASGRVDRDGGPVDGGPGRVRRAAVGGFAVGLAVALVLALATSGLPALAAGVGAVTPDGESNAAGTADDADGTPAAAGSDADTPTAVPLPPPTRSAEPPPASGDRDLPSAQAADGGNGSRYFDLRPTCERPPGLVVAIQVGALGANDEGAGDRGIRTTYRFASPRNRQFVGPFTNFRAVVRSEQYRPLLAHERVEYGPVERSGDAATRRVTVEDATGTVATYEFSLVRQTGARYDGCWMTEGVFTIDAPSSGMAADTGAGTGASDPSNSSASSIGPPGRRL
jgi:hypothetical protein